MVLDGGHGSGSVLRPGRIVFYAAILGPLAASNLVARALGIGFDATGLSWFWQYLDPEILTHDLFRGLLDLQAQPPVFNLFLGVVLKVAGTHATFVFSVLYQVMAFFLLAAMAWVMRRLAVPLSIIVALAWLYALHPIFIIYSHWLFYTLPVQLSLAVTAVALARFVDTGAARWAHAFTWLGALLLLMRPLYHPLWLLAVLGGAAIPLHGSTRRILLRAAVLPLLVVNLWYVKIWVQTGVYGANTWLGMNLRRELVLPAAEAERLVAAGKVPAVWLKQPFEPPETYKELGYFAQRTLAPENHPALDHLHKSTGYPNFNHREYARISRAMLAGDIAVIRTHPGAYLARVRRAVWLFLQPGPLWRFADFGRESQARVVRYIDLANGVFFLSGSLPGENGQLNLLVFAFPALLAYAATRSASRRTDPGARAVLIFVALAVAWVALCANLIEVGENDRIRAEIDPFLVVLAGVALSDLSRVGRFVLATRPNMSRNLPARPRRPAGLLRAVLGQLRTGRGARVRPRPRRLHG
jgi:hypothetical protein